MNLFKKLSPKPQNEAVPKSIITNYSYGEIPVEVEYNIDASMERLPYDFETLKKEGIDNQISIPSFYDYIYELLTYIAIFGGQNAVF